MTLPKERNYVGPIGRLEAWLASNPEIPHVRQRVNKAAICRQIGVARSTADANPEIRAIFVKLNLNMLAVTQATLAPISAQGNILRNSDQLPQDRGQPADARKNSLAFEHLLNTGRVVR